MKALRTAVLLAVSLGLLLPTSASAQKKVTIKMATLAPEKSAWMTVFKAGAKEIKKKSNGVINIKIYGGGRRGDEKVVVRKMLSGQLDGAAVTSVGLAQIAPEVLVLQAPRLIRNYKQLDYVRSRLKERFAKAMLKKGFVLLGWGDVGYTYLFTSKPVAKPSDMKGVKPWVWSSDPVMQSLFKLSGVRATPLPVPEVLQNLTTGLIDSFYTSPLAAIALQWGDYAKHITGLPITIGVGATVVTKKAWDKATPEQRALIQSVNKKWHNVLINKVRKDNKSSVGVLKNKKGLQVTKVSAADKAAWEKLAIRVQNDLAGRIYPKSLLNEVKALVKQAK